ncbi:hypothetical protein MTO96_050178 [Rhipicephalus appendiculatus]
MSPTAPPSDAVAEETLATQDADVTSETEFRLVLSKNRKKRRQQSSTPLCAQLRPSALFLATHLQPLLPRTHLLPS